MKKSIFMLMSAAAAGAVASALAASIAAAEQEAIIRTALDYSDGCYSGAAERMERAIHPDLNKVYVPAY